MQPKISIITVCYNSEAHIEECIQSIVNQPYQNKEYIVIDGGSTDGTIDIINKYRDKISYFISESDRGISDAFNKGIRVATGDIIGILNSDDFMMPDVLSKIALEYEEGVDVYRGYCVTWNETLNTKRTLRPNNRFGVPPFGAVICHESSFITKERYAIVGNYNVDFKYVMDLELFVRMYKDKHLKVKFMDVCVITFRQGGASSSSALKIERERKELVLRNGGSILSANIYIAYHRIKYCIKITINTIRYWIRK